MKIGKINNNVNIYLDNFDNITGYNLLKLGYPLYLKRNYNQVEKFNYIGDLLYTVLINNNLIPRDKECLQIFIKHYKTFLNCNMSIHSEIYEYISGKLTILTN